MDKPGIVQNYKTSSMHISNKPVIDEPNRIINDKASNRQTDELGINKKIIFLKYPGNMLAVRSKSKKPKKERRLRDRGDINYKNCQQIFVLPVIPQQDTATDPKCLLVNKQTDQEYDQKNTGKSKADDSEPTNAILETAPKSLEDNQSNVSFATSCSERLDDDNAIAITTAQLQNDYFPVVSKVQDCYPLIRKKNENFCFLHNCKRLIKTKGSFRSKSGYESIYPTNSQAENGAKENSYHSYNQTDRSIVSEKHINSKEELTYLPILPLQDKFVQCRFFQSPKREERVCHKYLHKVKKKKEQLYHSPKSDNQQQTRSEIQQQTSSGIQQQTSSGIAMGREAHQRAPESTRSKQSEKDYFLQCPITKKVLLEPVGKFDLATTTKQIIDQKNQQAVSRNRASSFRSHNNYRVDERIIYCKYRPQSRRKTKLKIYPSFCNGSIPKSLNEALGTQTTDDSKESTRIQDKSVP